MIERKLIGSYFDVFQVICHVETFDSYTRFATLSLNYSIILHVFVIMLRFGLLVTQNKHREGVTLG